MAVTSFKQSTLGDLTKLNSFLAGNDFTPAGAFDLLETTTLASDTASVTFSGLDTYTDYKHLQLRIVGRTDRSDTVSFPGVQVNGDTGSNYANHQIDGDGSTASSVAELNRTNAVAGSLTAANNSANYFSAIILDVFNFADNNKNTTFKALSGNVENRLRYASGLYINTAAVTSITFVNNFSDSFVSGSRFSLYGIRAGA